ncbi:hypothetical protein [Flavobacterium sp. M31R6]|uniref:hypothetical protein n=1 Tax=Flavobacterium sp. M31R6 TaxID=2739062 RepID=UPI001568DB9E|nr:hypothetical protein [Flavobacterium sp. M31R6]QKJ63224.1 hypothetical protein HQN62_08785 [Flavobacterium sp. M31R6]
MLVACVMVCSLTMLSTKDLTFQLSIPIIDSNYPKFSTFRFPFQIVFVFELQTSVKPQRKSTKKNPLSVFHKAVHVSLSATIKFQISVRISVRISVQISVGSVSVSLCIIRTKASD